jgi:organic radical activating enzyme
MPTYQCTAACKSCGTFSSPRDKTWLTLDLITKAILEAAEAGYELVVFTGGEPTLAQESVLAGLRLSRSKGMRTRLVTNAWWASSTVQATATLALYRDAGLQELNLSTGDQHRRFVDIENVIRAAAAGRSLQLDAIVIMIELTEDRTVTRATLEEHPLFRELIDDSLVAPVMIVESPWMGLGRSTSYRYPDGMAANRSNVHARKGCDNVLTTTTIQADGRIGACCGLGMRMIPELQLGHIADTSVPEADAEAADDFLKRWIRVEGPERILAWAAEIDESIRWEDRYAHRCEACLRIYQDQGVRRVLIREHHRRVADVVAREWLLTSFEQERVDVESRD